MEYVLEANAISKRYKNFVALDGLSMHIPKGAIYGFVGRNGAGKTTLIRLICGLQEPSAGEYSLFGTINTRSDISEKRHKIGAVVESPSIYPDLTARENMRLQYLLLGKKKDGDAEKLLELVGLSDTGAKKAKNFSLGMRQRLGIAVALAGEPEFLILDEPVNGLDPQGIIEMRELILKLNRERGITVLISSHILDELSRLATHYGFIDGGRMIAEMSAKELERRCRKSISARVDDIKPLMRVLDEAQTEYTVTGENTAEIYGDVHVTELVHALDKENCTVEKLAEHDESLESFYMKLVGGEKNA